MIAEITREEWQGVHDWLDTIPAANVSARHCPECNDELNLHCGTLTHRWWYSHRYIVDCYFGGWRNRIKFDSKEQAENAEQIFK